VCERCIGGVCGCRWCITRSGKANEVGLKHRNGRECARRDRNSLEKEAVRRNARERESERARDGYASLERDGNKRRGLRGFAIETKAKSAFRSKMERGRRRIEMMKKEGKGERRKEKGEEGREGGGREKTEGVAKRDQTGQDEVGYHCWKGRKLESREEGAKERTRTKRRRGSSGARAHTVAAVFRRYRNDLSVVDHLINLILFLPEGRKHRQGRTRGEARDDRKRRGEGEGGGGARRGYGVRDVQLARDFSEVEIAPPGSTWIKRPGSPLSLFPPAAYIDSGPLPRHLAHAETSQVIRASTVTSWNSATTTLARRSPLHRCVR